MFFCMLQAFNQPVQPDSAADSFSWFDCEFRSANKSLNSRYVDISEMEVSQTEQPCLGPIWKWTSGTLQPTRIGAEHGHRQPPARRNEAPCRAGIAYLNLIVMPSTLLALASNLLAMASNLLAMASNLIAMAHVLSL